MGKIEFFLFGKVVYEYFGILYVEFLVGDLRFVDLRFVKFWFGIRDVISYGKVCLWLSLLVLISGFELG